MTALRYHEVAKLFGVTVSKIDLWRKKRGFPAPTVKMCRERLFDLDEVEAWRVANGESYA